MLTRPRMHVQAAMITTPTSDFGSACLLVRRDNGGPLLALSAPRGLGFPGGKREPDETAVECALREANEETGIDLHRFARLAQVLGRNGVPDMKRLWYLVHNTVAHPLLCIEVAAEMSAAIEKRLRAGVVLAWRFHDWTADRM